MVGVGHQGVEEDDEVEHSGEDDRKHGDLVEAAESWGIGWAESGFDFFIGQRLPDGSVRVNDASFAGVAAAEYPCVEVVGFELALVDSIDDEGRWTDEGLAEEPYAIVVGVNCVDPADEKAEEEEPHDSDGGEEGPSRLAQNEMPGTGKNDCDESGEGVETGWWRRGHDQRVYGVGTDKTRLRRKPY